MSTFSLKAKIEVCEALGLDPHRVCGEGIKFVLPVSGAPTVTVQLLVNDQQLKHFQLVMKNYELHEVQESKQE